MDTWGRRSRGVCPLAGIRVLVREFLPRDAELGDELMDIPGSGGRGSWHTQTQQFAGFPAAALCYR